MIKVRLYNDDFELSGYENIKIESMEDLNKLSKFDNGEIDELLVIDIVDYLQTDKAEEIVLKLTKLVAKNGKIIFQCGEAYEIAKAFSSYNIDLVTFNKLIFGNNPNIPKKLTVTINSLSDLLSKVAGFKIQKKRVNGYIFIVEAIRI